MKKLFIIPACILVTGICYAQITNDSTVPKKEEKITGIPKNVIDGEQASQRHPTADLVQRILNINTDRQPVLIQYQEDKETAQYVNELKSELILHNMQVQTQSSLEAVPAYTGTRYVNCSYQVTDPLFIITAYPKQVKQ